MTRSHGRVVQDEPQGRSSRPEHGGPKHATGAKGKTGAKRGFSLVDALVFLIGLGIFLYPLVASYLNYAETTDAVEEYDYIVNRLSPAQQRKMWRDAKQYDEDLGKPTLRDPFQYKEIQEPLGRYSKILNVDGKGMMGYVEIPKINVSLPIRHGTTDDVLKDGTGHIATTHVPTDNTTIHSVITGHTGEVGHILFDNLTQLKKGDVFQIRVLKRHMSYKVDQIKVVLPTEVSDLQPIEGSNYVTLLTCTPYGINSHRLLVRAKYIGDDVPATKPKGAPVYMLWVLLGLLALSLGCRYYLSGLRRKCVQQIEQVEHPVTPDSGPARVTGVLVSSGLTETGRSAREQTGWTDSPPDEDRSLIGETRQVHEAGGSGSGGLDR